MKWFTHKAVAIAGALVAGAHAGGLIAVALGSIAPDAMDTAIAHGDKQVWRRIHRQTTHWFGWYILIILLGLSLPLQPMVSDVLSSIPLFSFSWGELARLSRLGNDCIVWFGIGGLAHVLLDALTPMRVPLYPFGGTKRFGLPLVSTGTWRETVFLGLALLAIGLQFQQIRSLLLELFTR